LIEFVKIDMVVFERLWLDDRQERIVVAPRKYQQGYWLVGILKID